MRSDWLIWQLADSAFPAGALAHSCGLEAAVQGGLVVDGHSLREFLTAILRQLHCGVGVFVGRVWDDPDQFAKIDADCDLFLNSSVANRASRAQGRAFLATASQTFDVGALKQSLADLRREKIGGHLGPVFGLVCRSLAIGRDETLSLFAFTTARSCLSSAIRLGIVGPLEAQRIQATFSALAPSPGTPGEGRGEGGGQGKFVFSFDGKIQKSPHPNPLPEYRARGPECGYSPVQTAPFIDLLQSTQDRLYSRLFQS